MEWARPRRQPKDGRLRLNSAVELRRGVESVECVESIVCRLPLAAETSAAHRAAEKLSTYGRCFAALQQDGRRTAKGTAGMLGLVGATRCASRRALLAGRWYAEPQAPRCCCAPSV